MLAWTSNAGCSPDVCVRRNNDFLRRGSGALAALLAALALLGAPSADLGAQELIDRPLPSAPLPEEPPGDIADDDPGHFEIRSAETVLRSGVYLLDAWIDYRLSSDAREALQSGVPLTIRVDVEVMLPRRFWFDNEDATLRQRYQLEYHALSERYIVTNLNSGDQSSYPSVFAALYALGRIDRLPLIDSAVLDRDRDYNVRIRAALDAEELPGPLRLLAFWRRDWSIASDWYQWPLQDD
jgi:Domain of unknown function (DUF4390)